MGLLSLHALVTGILKHFKYNLLGYSGVQFVAPSSAELAAGPAVLVLVLVLVLVVTKCFQKQSGWEQLAQTEI